MDGEGVAEPPGVAEASGVGLVAGESFPDGCAIATVPKPATNSAAVIHLLLTMTFSNLIRRTKSSKLDGSKTANTSEQRITLLLESLRRQFQTSKRRDDLNAYDLLLDSKEEFNILVSDVEMPYMTGLELIIEARKIEQFKNFPIILISALDSPAHRKRGLEVGANAYVAKSNFNSSDLISTIDRLLTK